MNKKLASLVLSGLIVLNSTGSIENVYADNDNKPKELMNNEDTKSNRVVYLEDGEGAEGVGDGSANKPYQNIRTALEKIQNGDTLKIKGTVQYTKYKQDNNGAALPLEIDKAITIEGEAGAVLSVNAPIQLKANVTFKDLHLELVPEVSLGRATTKSSERMLGTIVERSTTIYVNGHELTLDNINTKVGTNLDQSKDRPYISGGSHKSSSAPTGKSVINIINSNDETRFSGIYAGDYNEDVTLDVDINIDGKAKVADNKIYTGGHNHNLNGTVNINLSASDSNNKSNSITKFDKANHNGNVNVNLNKDAFVYDFDATNLNDLTLEEGSKIILSNNSKFNVNNVVLKNNATIDFKQMTENNLTVKGNFTGETTTDSSKKGGIIVLGRSQELDINGKLSGTTRLSHSNVEMFEDGRVYVKAKEVSDGEFILEDGIFDYYELKEVKNGNGIDWEIVLLKDIFSNFEFIDDNKIEAMNDGTNSGKGRFKIEFTNIEGNKYVPFYEMDTDFKHTLTVIDENGNKEEIGLDEKNKLGIEFYILSDYDYLELGVSVANMDKLKDKKVILTASHIESKKSISKVLYNDLKTPELEVPDEDIKPDKEGWIKASTLAQANKLWDYTTNEQNKTIVINSFKGANTQRNTDVKIEIPRVIDGYKVELADLKSDMFPGVTHIKVAKAKDGEGQVKVLATNLMNGFANNDTLKYVNLEGLDVSGVDNMYGLFSFCKNLRVIEINDWIIKDTTDTTAMFYAKKDASYEEKKILVVSNSERVDGYNFGLSNRIPAIVTFNSNGGYFLGDTDILNMKVGRFTVHPGVLEELDKVIESDVRFAGIPTREGYKFKGWYTEDATPTNFYELLNMTYKARWEKVVVDETPEKPPVVEPEVPETPEKPPVVEPEVPETPEKPPVVEPEVPETPEKPPVVEPEVPEIPEEPPVVEPEVPETPEKPPVEEPSVPEVPEETPSIPDVPSIPEIPEETPSTPEVPSIPENKPEQSIIEDISKIEGIEVEVGNATMENPISVKVDTVSGLTNLLYYYTSNNFKVDSTEVPKEEGDFLVYLVRITKKTITRSTETYFMEIKVSKDNKEVIEKLESVVDTNNTNNGNDTTVEEDLNNNTSSNDSNNNSNNSNSGVDNNNSNNNNNIDNNVSNDNNNSNSINSVDNNTSNDSNVESNSTETKKEESLKTYDGGISSYLLSGISSIGLLSILNKKKKRKK